MDATANLALQQKGWADERGGREPCSGPHRLLVKKRFPDPDRQFQRFGMGPRVKPEDD
jgi:hypothetical protein